MGRHRSHHITRRRYAFVEYENEDDMRIAYKRGDGRKIDGRRVIVDVERGRTVRNWLVSPADRAPALPLAVGFVMFCFECCFCGQVAWTSKSIVVCSGLAISNFSCSVSIYAVDGEPSSQSHVDYVPCCPAPLLRERADSFDFARTRNEVPT